MKKEIYGAVIAGLVALSGPLAAQDTSAQNFPEKAVTLVVPFGAGGGSDTLSRTIAGSVQEHLGQPLTIKMQPGASGTIATTEFAKSATPDGYEIIVTGTGATTTIPHTREVSYDPFEDFEFIIGVVALNEVLAVREDFPAKTAEEFIAYVKEHPGEVSLGQTGTGGEDWALIRLLANSIGAEITDVPFDGAGDAALAAAGGHIDGVIASHTSVTPFVSSGKLRILAVLRDEPVEGLDVPTMPSLGFPDVVLNSRLGFAAPAGTPKEVVQKLHDAFKATMEDESFQSMARRLNMSIGYIGMEDYREALRGDFSRIGTLHGSN